MPHLNLTQPHGNLLLAAALCLFVLLVLLSFLASLLPVVPVEPDMDPAAHEANA